MLNHWIDTLNGWLHRWRYLKFGLVGASGTVVNLFVLWLGQEFVFQFIADSNERLYSSLALAIAVATLNNFIWNRIWTWNDRADVWQSSLLKQFARYAMASWLGTCVQYILTLWLAQHVHYLAGNIAAIVVASVINYFANDWWTFKGQSREISDQEQADRFQKISLALLLLAGLMYVLDLGGENIPRNGDELVYAHIAFKTWLHAQSTGQWLPLMSDIENMRNTKPPLLIWQAMSVGWLHLPWSLWWLRLPSVLYTLASTYLCVWSARALAQDWLQQQREQVRWPATITPATLGYLVGLIFLGCFSTYRYGRPYLTSAAETFWMSLPLVFLLREWLQARRLQQAFVARSGLWAVTVLSWGLVAWYKSFVLIAPLALSLWLGLSWMSTPRRAEANSLQNPDLRSRGVLDWHWLIPVSLCAIAACAIFALWFVVDPNPADVWQEFVVGENWGKVDAATRPYWHTAMVGGYSIWVQSLALLQNGAMLGPLIMAVMLWGLVSIPRAWRTRWTQTQPQALLWIHLLVVTLFFMVPSQRSARYLIPLMPFAAVLSALYVWQLRDGVQRLVIATGTLLSLVGLAFLSLFLWAGWRAELYPLWGRLALLLILVLQVIALLRLLQSVLHRAEQRPGAWLWLTGLVLSLFTWFGMLSAPLNAPSNQYTPEIAEAVKGQTLATPSNFNGDFERWRFMLPQVASITPYTDSLTISDARMMELLQTHDTVIVWRYWNEGAPACQPDVCTVLASRIALRGRHGPGDVTLRKLRKPERVMFWREYLVTRSHNNH